MRLGLGLGFNRRRRGSAGVPIGNQDVVLASASTIDLDGPFADYSGDPQTLTYSVTAGTPPVGMAVSGYQLTGTPLNEIPRDTLTIQATDGGSYTETAQFDLGCTCKSGLPAPNFANFRIDSTAAIASGLDSDVTVSTNIAALNSAIETALMDGGTATSPKIHRITWTGGSLASDFINATGYAGTPSDYSWCIVDGGGETVQYVQSHYHGIILHDWVVTGSASPARRAIHEATSGLQVEGSKVGPWFGAEWDTDATFPVGNGDMEAAFVSCHLAGGSDIFAPQSHKLTVQDCLMTHMSGDGFHHFDTTPTSYEQRLIGNVMAISRKVIPGAHPDIWQSGGAPTTDIQMYENIWIGDAVTPTPYGYRFGSEMHTGGDIQMDAKSNIWSLSGFYVGGAPAGSTSITGAITLEDHITFPAPGFGAKGDGFAIGASSLVTTTMRDATVYHAAQSDITNAGTIARYDHETAASIEAQFPNMTGSVVTFTEHGTEGSTTTYVPDLIQALHNVRDWRSKISTLLQPSGGWGASVHADPASYGTVGLWAAPGTYTAPTLSAGSATGTTLTITCSEANGKLWAFTSANSSAPNFTMLRHGCEPDGTHSADPTADVDIFDVTATGSQNYTLSQDATGKYVYVVHETDDGEFSAVSSITASAADTLTYIGVDAQSTSNTTRTHSFTGGVNGNRVVAFVCEGLSGNSIDSVTIGGVSATFRGSQTSSSKHIHIYDAVLTADGAFDVVVSSTGGNYTDTGVIAYDVGSKTYLSNVGEDYTGVTKAIDLSANTSAGDFVILASWSHVNTTLTVGTGWTRFDVAEGNIRNVDYWGGSHEAAGGTPETMQINYTTAWAHCVILSAVYS